MLQKEKYFNVMVRLVPTGEVFPLKKLYGDMKIKELKHLAEYSTGIPYHIQRLHYLDEGDLQDYSDVRHNDIVAGAVLHMNVWNVWRSLVEAVASNDIEYVFKLGVTKTTAFKTPNSEYMPAQAKADWIADRAFTALYIASHRGYLKMVQKLIDAGANVNACTKLGQSPLHVAAAQGHGTVVDLLLEKGADIDAEDEFGESALAVASRFGHKGCERHLFLFRWQQRAKNLKLQPEHEMFAHQYHDSAFPVWLKGNHAQIYYTQILPPGEFEGTTINAPRRQLDDDELQDDHSHGASGDKSSVDWYPPRRPAVVSTGLTTAGFLRNTMESEGGHRQADGLSAIREEASSSRTGASLRSNKSLPDLKQDDVGRKNRGRRKRNSKQTASKEQSFEEWLRAKQTAEQTIIDQQKREEARRKLAEEDRKLQEELQDKSYDQWLAEKETPKKPASKAPTITPANKAPAPSGANSEAPQVSGDAATGSKKSSGPATAESIIRTIVQRRQEEAEAAGLPSMCDDWLVQRDESLLEEIRLGRTPLQVRLQQKVI